MAASSSSGARARSTAARPASRSPAGWARRPINLVPVETLPAAHAPAAARQVGLRPEDLRLDGVGPEAAVEQVEPLGAETVVLLRLNGSRLHALVSGETGLRPGDVCRIDVAPDAFLFFGGEGRRLAA